MKRGLSGFTLIELMVTIAIIAVVVAIALPSYQQYLTKGRRAAAQAQMMEIANREQQFILANRIYASKATLVANGYSLPGDVAAYYGYDITVDNSATPPTFLITFDPSGSQDADGNLTLDQNGSKTPSNKW